MMVDALSLLDCLPRRADLSADAWIVARHSGKRDQGWHPIRSYTDAVRAIACYHELRLAMRQGGIAMLHAGNLIHFAGMIRRNGLRTEMHSRR